MLTDSDRVHLGWLRQNRFSNFNQRRVVDLGCGSGALSRHILEQGAAKVVAVDISPPVELSARNNPAYIFLSLNLDRDFSAAVLEPLDGQKPDLILAFDILEHLVSPWNFVSTCKNLLEPGGSLVLTTPNTNSWEKFVKPQSWSGGFDAQHKILFTAYSLEFMLKRAGFNTTQVSAPINKLHFMQRWLPMIGGQLLCIARP